MILNYNYESLYTNYLNQLNQYKIKMQLHNILFNNRINVPIDFSLNDQSYPNVKLIIL
ncbi:hypothetical protein LY11_02600 [Pedobacter cryoconitis]|uniref:Uncharacterized protein n=1 Tax=Pedobacter cryoconitis TaxID=188932 RepID=A0A327SN23_9SPHI|nr:hypothetical protein LY11_02600 [Pedobacter cryoconitis]